MDISPDELFQRIGYLTVLAEKQAARITQLEQQSQPDRPALADPSTTDEEAHVPAPQPPQRHQPVDG